MEEINPNQSIPPTYPASPVPPANSGQSFFKKPVGLVLLVIIVLAVLLIFGSLIIVKKPAVEMSAVDAETKMRILLQRIQTADSAPLSEEEKEEWANFLTDPAIQNIQMTREDQMRIIEAFHSN